LLVESRDYQLISNPKPPNGGKLQPLSEKQKVGTDWNGSAVPIHTVFCFSERDWSLPPSWALKVKWEQAVADGKTHQLRDILQTQLLHDISAMRLHRFDAQYQLISNLLIGMTFSDQL
jgi:hypothetical protein